MKSIYWRLRQDFLMRSRIPEYRRLFELAREAGYRVIDHREALTHPVSSGGKRLLLRHDIDTDPQCALMMGSIIADIGGSASFFFRKSTVDVEIMNALSSRGMYVSYHFEELATVIKQRAAFTLDAARACIPEARELFVANLERLRSDTGLSLEIVCSHGDWANRAVNLRNIVLLEDPEFRKFSRVRAETYDTVFMDGLQHNFSDRQLPIEWSSGTPFDAIPVSAGPISILIHPRQWRSNPAANFRETLIRVKEGFVWNATKAAAPK